MKKVLLLGLLLPVAALGESPFTGTWELQPELTTFGEHPMELMIERGAYRRSDCGQPLNLPTDGSDYPVKGEPLFDTMSVRLVDGQHVDVVQKVSGKIAWKGSYAVSKDRRSMVLEFDDERSTTPVTGAMQYSRVGDPVSAAHLLSGTWRPEKLIRQSAGGATVIIQEKEHGLTISWSDGRTVDSHLDAKYYPLNGYLPGAQVSILNSRVDTLAINREQGVIPVEVSRAVISDDGHTLTFSQVDWICHAVTTHIYRKKAAS